MKRWVWTIVASVILSTMLFAGCVNAPVTKYSSWTEEKNADGTTKVIRTESASQTDNSGKVKLEKIKLD